jgi:ribosomal-protein-alanine N-acetyltransferase
MSRSAAKAVEVGGLTFIRYPTRTDRTEYLQLLRDSADFHRRFAPPDPADPNPYAPAAFDRFLRGARSERARRLLVCRREDDAIVGRITLGEICRGFFQSAYMGYWVGAPFANHGYMSDAIPLVVRHAFTELALHRLEANIQPDNAASIALIKKCGFRHEGFSPRYLKIGGTWCDHERYALTVEDWE